MRITEAEDAAVGGNEPVAEPVGAIPTTVLFNGGPPAEPKKPALPKLKIPPSDASIQYEEFTAVDGAGAGEGGPGRPAEPEKA